MARPEVLGWPLIRSDDFRSTGAGSGASTGFSPALPAPRRMGSVFLVLGQSRRRVTLGLREPCSHPRLFAATLVRPEDACLAINLPALAAQDRAPVLTLCLLCEMASLASSESAGAGLPTPFRYGGGVPVADPEACGAFRQTALLAHARRARSGRKGQVRSALPPVPQSVAG